MNNNYFEQVIGESIIKKTLSYTVNNKSYMSAYIISGAEGTGKKLIARSFAKAIVGTEKQFHPDILELESEKPNLISVNEIRDNIVENAFYKPFISDYKVLIIPDAHRMNVQAQNSLLKTLEEPPEYCVIILTSSKENALIQTIRSRSIELKTQGLSLDEIDQYINKKIDNENILIDNEDKELIKNICFNDICTINKLLENKNRFEVEKSILRLSTTAPMTTTRFLSFITENEALISFDRVLELLLIKYSRILIYSETLQVDFIALKGYEESIIEEASILSRTDILEIINEIKKANSRFNNNVKLGYLIVPLIGKLSELRDKNMQLL